MIRVVIADDHAMIRVALAKMINASEGIVVVGEATHGGEVMDQVRHLNPDVLLLDLSMPMSNGMEVVLRVRQERPSVPILILSMHTEGPLVYRALKSGAAGYVTKSSEANTLLAGIRKVAAGEKFIDPCLINQLVFESMAAGEQEIQVLTNREYQILQMLAQGKSVTRIAQQLSLSVKTISSHKCNIKEKLGLQADADLFRYAIDHRL